MLSPSELGWHWEVILKVLILKPRYRPSSCNISVVLFLFQACHWSSCSCTASSFSSCMHSCRSLFTARYSTPRKGYIVPRCMSVWSQYFTGGWSSVCLRLVMWPLGGIWLAAGAAFVYMSGHLLIHVVDWVSLSNIYHFKDLLKRIVWKVITG